MWHISLIFWCAAAQCCYRRIWNLCCGVVYFWLCTCAEKVMVAIPVKPRRWFHGDILASSSLLCLQVSSSLLSPLNLISASIFFSTTGCVAISQRNQTRPALIDSLPASMKFNAVSLKNLSDFTMAPKFPPFSASKAQTVNRSKLFSFSTLCIILVFFLFNSCLFKEMQLYTKQSSVSPALVNCFSFPIWSYLCNFQMRSGTICLCKPFLCRLAPCEMLFLKNQQRQLGSKPKTNKQIVSKLSLLNTSCMSTSVPSSDMWSRTGMRPFITLPDSFLYMLLVSAVLHKWMNDCPLTFPGLRIRTENPVSQKIKHFLKLWPLGIVVEVLAEMWCTPIGSPTSFHKVVSKPRTFELKTVPASFQEVGYILLNMRYIREHPRNHS